MSELIDIQIRKSDYDWICQVGEYYEGKNQPFALYLKFILKFSRDAYQSSCLSAHNPEHPEPPLGAVGHYYNAIRKKAQETPLDKKMVEEVMEEVFPQFYGGTK